MTDPSRRAIAYIAANIISEAKTSAVYDYTVGKYFTFSIQVLGGNINAFDYTEGCHVSGSGNNRSFSLFHYGNNGHMSLNIESNNSFSGYDYYSGKYFSGSVNGRNITIYDYGNSRYFNYSI